MKWIIIKDNDTTLRLKTKLKLSILKYTNMGYFKKAFVTINTGIGIYGFTRGYRSRLFYEEEDVPRLTINKITSGLLNGFIYMIPPWNIFFISKMINRIEIEKRNLDKNKYKDEYDEIVGRCFDTY